MLQQLSVFIENEIGSLNRVTHVIYESGINLQAISAFDSPDFCILRIVVDRPEEAKKILIGKGYAVKVSEVVAVELVDQPGELNHVLGLLAKEGLSLNYIYSLVLRGEKAPLMVMNLNDNEKAYEVLKKNNLIIVD